MPRFEPFRGIRYDVDRLDPVRVTAPPYDVISPDRSRGPARSGTGERGPDRPARGRPRRARRGSLHRRGGAVRGVAGAGRPGRRSDPVVHRLPHGGSRRGRGRPPHHRRHRGPRAEPTGRGRHPPPRVHHSQGQERPSRPAPVDDGQPLPRVGAVPRRRAHRPARQRRGAPGPVRGRRGAPHGVARRRSRPGRRHRRRHRGRADRDRRRPPPLRDLPRLPRRAPRRLPRRHRRRRRGGALLRGRAGR